MAFLTIHVKMVQRGGFHSRVNSNFIFSPAAGKRARLYCHLNYSCKRKRLMLVVFISVRKPDGSLTARLDFVCTAVLLHPKE